MIDPIWIAQFIGFFCGEGMVNMHKNQKGRSYAVYCRIQLRDDDSEVLYDIQSKLGGIIRRSPNGNPNSKPVIQWAAYDLDTCLTIYNLIKDSIVIPFRKKKEIEIWGEALQIRKSKSGYERLAEICNELHKLKRYPD